MTKDAVTMSFDKSIKSGLQFNCSLCAGNKAPALILTPYSMRNSMNVVAWNTIVYTVYYSFLWSSDTTKDACFRAYGDTQPYRLIKKFSNTLNVIVTDSVQRINQTMVKVLPYELTKHRLAILKVDEKENLSTSEVSNSI